MPSAIPQDEGSNAGSNKAKVTFGIFQEPVPAGTTVGDARKTMKSVGGMGDDTVAYINGQKVDEGTPLEGGQSLTFIKRSGEKG